jgi:cytidine deaminase
MPVYLVSSTYERIEQIKDEKIVLVRTIEELLPMSFGPEQLDLERA